MDIEGSLKEDEEEKAARWFNRQGQLSVFFLRSSFCAYFSNCSMITNLQRKTSSRYTIIVRRKMKEGVQKKL